MRWLFIEPGRIGDWIISTAAVRYFIRDNSNSVDWLVRPEVVQILDRFVEFGKSLSFPAEISLKKTLKLIQDIRLAKYDGLCVLSPGISAWLVGKAIGVEVKMGYLRYPYRQKDEPIYSINLNCQKQQYKMTEDHIVIRAFKAIGADINIDLSAANIDNDYYPKIRFMEEDKGFAWDILENLGIKKDKPMVVLHPGARWKYKRWPTERWIELARGIAKRGNQILVGAGSEEIEIAKEISKKSSSNTYHLSKPVSLSALAAILREASLLITCDSAVMHLGAAAGTPVVAIFGPTTPRLSGPLGEASKIAIAKTSFPLSCHPCTFPSEDTRKKRCAIGDWSCMITLECSNVIKAIKSLNVIEV